MFYYRLKLFLILFKVISLVDAFLQKLYPNSIREKSGFLCVVVTSQLVWLLHTVASGIKT